MKYFAMRGKNRRKREPIINIAEIGRERKIIGFPLERIKDCRNAFSNIGPSTKAKTSGAGS